MSGQPPGDIHVDASPEPDRPSSMTSLFPEVEDADHNPFADAISPLSKTPFHDVFAAQPDPTNGAGTEQPKFGGDEAASTREHKEEQSVTRDPHSEHQPLSRDVHTAFAEVKLHSTRENTKGRDVEHGAAFAPDDLHVNMISPQDSSSSAAPVLTSSIAQVPRDGCEKNLPALPSHHVSASGRYEPQSAHNDQQLWSNAIGSGSGFGPDLLANPLAASPRPSPPHKLTEVFLSAEADTRDERLRSPHSHNSALFEITVSEPTKAGDIAPYTAYKVRTRTAANGFKSSDFTVTRRYRDFLWLYNQLSNGNPGVIVPPPPEKQSLGRFAEGFIENRRVMLERCLNKIAAHPLLYSDPDFKTFLESVTFTAEKKESSPGLMKAFGEAVSNATGGFVKFTETDEWFENKKSEVDVLETQLKSLYKSVEALVKQRKDLGLSCADLGEAMAALAAAETSKPILGGLGTLAKLQRRLQELHERQAQHEIGTLENTVDEYVRIIGSIKFALGGRTKAFQTWQTAETDLQKRKASLEKSKTPGRSRPDKVQQLQAEVLDMELKASHTRREYEEISKLIRTELDRFDKERVEDFKSTIEDFLAAMVATQKEIIKLWEAYIPHAQKYAQNAIPPPESSSPAPLTRKPTAEYSPESQLPQDQQHHSTAT